MKKKVQLNNLFINYVPVEYVELVVGHGIQEFEDQRDRQPMSAGKGQEDKVEVSKSKQQPNGTANLTWRCQ